MKRWHNVVVLLFFAAAIRFSGVAKDTRLHPDEALYADLSRVMMVDGDVNLIYRTTDKTPLTFFFTGTSIALLGESEFAVRLPGVFFSLIGLAGLYAVGKQLAGEQAGLLALALAAVSPLEIRYTPSAFQDVPMLAMLIIALWQLTLHRWTSAGFFYGVAVMMKPTALWVLPVIMVGGRALFGVNRSATHPLRHFAQRPSPPCGEGLRVGWGNGIIMRILHSHPMVRFLPGFVIPIVAVILWDWGRPQSLFSTGASNNNPGRLVRSDEVWPRFEVWLEHIRDIFPAGDVVLVILVVMMIYGVYRTRNLNKLIELFSAFILIYFALHWLVAFNIYDRYMLIIAPLVWLVGGVAIAKSLPFGAQFVLVAIIIFGGTPGAYDAAQYDFAPELHDIDHMAQTLRDDYQDRIIYDHWLNWELGWYGGGELWVVYFATPEELADHLQGEEGERFFIAPSVDHARVWVYLLNARGIQTQLVLEQDGYVLYSVVPRG